MRLLKTMEGIAVPQKNPKDRMKEYVLVENVVSASGSTAWIAGSWVVRGGPTPILVRISNQAQATVLVEG